jgi:hypothetical protein
MNGLASDLTFRKLRSRPYISTNYNKERQITEENDRKRKRDKLMKE